MVPADEQPNVRKEESSFPARFLDSAILFSLILGGCYYVGWQHEHNYLARLGVPQRWIEFSTAHYLVTAFPPILIVAMPFVVAWATATVTKNARIRGFVENGALLITVLACSYPAFIVWIKIVAYIAFFCVLGAGLIIYFHFSMRGISGLRCLATASTPLKALVSVYLLLAVGQVAGTIGFNHAVGVLQGTWPAEWVTISPGKLLDDGNAPDAPWILLIHSDGKYFLTRQANPAPKSPRVFVVRDDQVELAAIQTSPDPRERTRK